MTGRDHADRLTAARFAGTIPAPDPATRPAPALRPIPAAGTTRSEARHAIRTQAAIGPRRSAPIPTLLAPPAFPLICSAGRIADRIAGCLRDERGCLPGGWLAYGAPREHLIGFFVGCTG